ncbi:pirin family protein [Nocardioides albertanoniae]|uniref:pirin family protein n=1 Tax=Nocardioides albertanoniae TaxID=1175486 RepID=UPI0014777C4A|nr:pirin family protein [Nocardioides albertanoniae]
MTWHTYSFGPFYDPDRIGFGPIVTYDEHLLRNGEGFDTHHHAGVTILTWPLSGEVTHTDSTGTTATVAPGQLGVFASGDGVDHSEVASAAGTRFIQAWISGSTGDPTYAVRDVAAREGEWTEAVRLEQGTLWIGHVGSSGPAEITLPDARLRHLHVASGALLRSGMAEPLAAGDAYEITADEGAESTPFTISAGVPTELLLWCFE